MDHSFVMHVKKSVSVVQFPDHDSPKRSLDLGCGVSHVLHHIFFQLRDDACVFHRGGRGYLMLRKNGQIANS